MGSPQNDSQLSSSNKPGGLGKGANSAVAMAIPIDINRHTSMLGGERLGCYNYYSNDSINYVSHIKREEQSLAVCTWCLLPPVSKMTVVKTVI